MSQTIPPAHAIQAATDAVVEYALLSLQQEFLCWEKDVNMRVAEFVWNAGGRNLDPSVFSAPGGDLPDLVRTLCRARRAVPPESDDVLLLGLDVHDERGEIHFTFDLSWDEGDTFQACKIAVDFPVGDPAQLN